MGKAIMYKNPTPTVDIIIERGDRIVLIERANAPYGWALPGGFVDEGERVERAAIREAREETQLEVTLIALLYVYSDPSRDPRKHTLSVVFIARAEGEAKAADDAKALRWVDPRALPEPMCFDHAQIIADYVRWRDEGGIRPDPMRALEGQ